MRKSLFLENLSAVKNQEEREANSRTCVRMCVFVGIFVHMGFLDFFLLTFIFKFHCVFGCVLMLHILMRDITRLWVSLPHRAA